jgi:hypothetical protein
MKSEHRHELETNWLAHHVAIWIERVRPYNSLIVGSLLALVVVLAAYSFFGGETAARQAAAWRSYNESVEGSLPNLDRLHESADEYPDSPVQEFADITWADGQVAIASRYFIQNRTAANEALNRATGTYQSLLRESEDERIKSRAHFGLGRVFELQNDLDKARTEYQAVTGSFIELAKQRIKELEKPSIQKTYEWLATAEGPRRPAPSGPGTPGVRPGFTPGELELPAASSTSDETNPNISIDDLFKGFDGTGNADDAGAAERYEGDETSTEQPPADESSADAATPDTDETKPVETKSDDAKPKE